MSPATDGGQQPPGQAGGADGTGHLLDWRLLSAGERVPAQATDEPEPHPHLVPLTSTTAVTVSHDITGGIIDRFRSLDVPGTTVLAGHVVASLLRNLVRVRWLNGARGPCPVAP